MSLHMLGKISLSELQGPMNDFQRKLAGDGGPQLFEDFKKLLRGELTCASAESMKAFKAPVPNRPNPEMFEYVGRVLAPKTTGTFCAKSWFVVDRTECAPVKIDHICVEFISRFITGDGKIEKESLEINLDYLRLTKLKKQREILAELGGQARTEIELSTIFALMEKQRDGRCGPLQTDGWWNVFFSHGCAIGVRWNGTGWGVSANPNGTGGSWGADIRVFVPALLSDHPLDAII